MKKTKKFLSILLLICILYSNFTNIFAKSISESEKVNLLFDHDCVSVLKIKGKDVLKQVAYVCYTDPDTGKKYPAFCVEPAKEGIGTGAINSYDISLSELSNPILWRMLYKGYVGSTYTSWGLECDDDLYFATKTAVHCFADGSTPTSKYEIPHRVGYGDNVTLEEVQRRGAKVLEVAQAIYDYAYSSTDNYIKASISISKNGNLSTQTIDGTKYAVQNYSVTANKTLSSYNVEISNFPLDTKILSSSNNSTNTMTNSNFKIAIPTNSINENFTGNINIIDAKVESFPIFYGNSGNDATQNYVIADPSEITTASTNLFVDAYKSGIKILKVDDKLNTPIKSVTFNIKYADGTNIGDFVTDKNGNIFVGKLKQGKVIVTEKLTLNEYILDTTPYEINLEYDEIKDITIENEKIKGYLEITKVDAKNNNIKLKDAVFGIYNEKNELVDTIKTDANGKAISKLLEKGKYYLKELETGSAHYLLNETTFNFEIINNNETVPILIENEPTDIEVTVDKQGDIETKPNEIVHYSFSNISNKSNTYLDSFKWFDYIPINFVRIEKITTGTWNQELLYKIYYKTNKSDEYVLYKDNLNTKENYEIDFSNINLENGEYITEFYFDFKKVDIGFKEEISPTLECRTLESVENNSSFTNYTKTIGNYNGIEAEADSKWTTVVHIPKKPEPILPRTGK